jgi:pimeloyl-ACP methyl ester carboxylesterase
VVEKRTLTLADGRSLVYREFGPQTGRPIVWCHGGFMSGLDIEPWRDALLTADARVIAPARPGVDGSAPAPGRNTGDWADDVRALLDALELRGASVFGWSMGGQYALACAALLPDRITRAVCIAGALPLDDPASFRELNKLDQRLTKKSEHSAWMARLEIMTLASIAKYTPRLWTRILTKDLPEAEAAAVRALSDPALARAAASGLSNTKGVIGEYLAWARPWGFDIGDISVPTTIWQGTADTLIPARWGEELAKGIPNARLRMCTDEGHFVAFSHQAEILDDLTRS